MGSRYIEVFQSSIHELKEAGRGPPRRRSRSRERYGRRDDYGGGRYGDRGDYGRPRDDYHRRGRSPPRYGSSSSGGRYDTYSTHNPVDDSHCVKVERIPITASHEDVTAFFQRVDLTPYRIHRKQGGDEAFVEFYSASDAGRAAQQHRQYLGQESISVFRVPYNEMADIVGLPRQEPPTPVVQQPYYHTPQPYGAYPTGHAPPPADPYHPYGARAPPPTAAPMRYDPYAQAPAAAAPAPYYGAPHAHPSSAPSPYGAPSVGGPRPAGGARIKMQGLPYRATHDDILRFFTGYDIIPESIEFGVNHEGRPDGQGYVEFRSLAEAERAYKERNRQYIGDRYVKLFVN